MTEGQYPLTRDTGIWIEAEEVPVVPVIQEMERGGGFPWELALAIPLLLVLAAILVPSSGMLALLPLAGVAVIVALIVTR